MTYESPQESSRMPMIALLAMALAVGAAALIGRAAEGLGVATAKAVDGRLWLEIEVGEDHIDAETLARELVFGPGGVEIVDLRGRPDFQQWSLPGAHNLTLPELLGAAGDEIFAKQPRLVVLCSHGTMHAGQAWVALRERGRSSVRVLEGGLEEFRDRIRKPPSLRLGKPKLPGDVDYERALALDRVYQAAFDPVGSGKGAASWGREPEALESPCVVTASWLEARRDRVAVIDVRGELDYATAHVPGSVRLDVARLRQTGTKGDPHPLLPDAELAATFGALGVADATPVVLVHGDRPEDAALAALALLRLEHRAVGLLEGGFLRWVAQRRPVTDAVTAPVPATHGIGTPGDDFTIGLSEVAASVAAGTVAVVDVRSELEFRGAEPRDARRGGHVPGARRLGPERLVYQGTGTLWVGPEALRERWAAVDGGQPAVVMCHSGHRAAAAFFAARYLLGRTDVKWFEGSWLAWAADGDLPVETK